jgi:hypothetical protein
MEMGSQAGAVKDASNCLLDRKGASAFLKEKGYQVASATLAKLASIGGGPVYRRFGRKPLYTSSDLLEWAESRCSAPIGSTSEISSPKAGAPGTTAVEAP